MYRFNKILVAVDFTATDHSVLAYAGHIARMANSSQVYLVHSAPNLEIPEEIREKYPTIIEPLDEYALKRMQELTEQYFSAAGKVDLKFEVTEGDPLNNLLTKIKEQAIDLVLVGKPADAELDTLLGEKLARKAPCSVLIIPDGTDKIYRNIGVAVDFSNHSVDALDVARAFTLAAGLKSFTCVHVYDVPSGFHKTGKSYEQFDAIMQNNATHQFITMMKLLDMKEINPELELIRNKKPARALENFVAQSDVDLLVIGARGRARGAGILLGSVTEHVIQLAKVPVLAVKKKGTGMDLLDAILNT